VEQPAIEHRLKLSSQTLEVQRIGNDKVRVDAASCGLRLRRRHRGLGHIDSQNAQPQRGDIQGVLTRPASRIEHRAGENAFVRQTHYRRLWTPNVPRRRAIAIRRIPRLPGKPLVTRGYASAVWIVGLDANPLGNFVASRRLFDPTASSHSESLQATLPVLRSRFAR
jgi:hypothetical protein